MNPRDLQSRFERLRRQLLPWSVVLILLRLFSFGRASLSATKYQRDFVLARRLRTYSSSRSAFVSFGSAARHC